MFTTIKPSQVGRIRELTNEMIAEEASLQMFMKLSSDLHCIINKDGHVSRLNDAWERQLGWTQLECMEHPLTHFMHPDDIPTATKCLSVTTGETVQFIARLRLKNTGRFISYDWTAATGKDGNTYATARATST